MLNIIHGEQHNKEASSQLIEKLNGLNVQGELYLGYPIISTFDGTFNVDALLVSENIGLIAFSFYNETKGDLIRIKEIADKLYYNIEATLRRHDSLRIGRQLAVKLSVVILTLTSTGIDESSLIENNIIKLDNLDFSKLDREELSSKYIKHLNAALERVTTIRPHKKREKVHQDNSKGYKIKKIEKEMANLDIWQNKAAIEMPDGVQRIRGLAGSGKTIVLALKASYLHTLYPNLNIVVTYYTRSLQQQLVNLIERFYFSNTQDKPNWSKLRIMNAWGSQKSPGVYSEIAYRANHQPLDFISAKEKYGDTNAFDGVCNELCKLMIDPFYDIVIIDEAQDFPASFFKLIYKATKAPKRIAFAYDELQNLNDNEMLSIDDLFGRDDEGKPLVTIENEPDKPMQDILLPVCYRNPSWIISLAHAIGLGIYRDAGITQFFNNPDILKDIGYHVDSGKLDLGNNVVLNRENSAPKYFKELLSPDESIAINTFINLNKQYDWIASEINTLIENEELDYDDIMIIVPDPHSVRENYNIISRIFIDKNIPFNYAGRDASDIFICDNEVTVTSIYRAKGNEAPVVFLVNSEYCAVNLNISKVRNIFFTGATRARAWLYITGVGERMSIIENELKALQEKQYTLSFTIPTREQLESIRKLNVENNQRERNSNLNINRITQMIENGEINVRSQSIKNLYKVIKKKNE